MLMYKALVTLSCQSESVKCSRVAKCFFIFTFFISRVSGFGHHVGEKNEDARLLPFFHLQVSHEDCASTTRTGQRININRLSISDFCLVFAGHVNGRRSLVRKWPYGRPIRYVLNRR